MSLALVDIQPTDNPKITEITVLKEFEEMTNRDVLKALYPIDENKGARLIKVYLDHEPIESFALTTTQKWLDSPYKGGE